MVGSELAIFENQLAPLAPRFSDVLGQLLPVERLIGTALICCERTPALLVCDRQSLILGVMTFAALALPIDGVTGQGYLIPFNDRKQNKKIAQPVIGYKGFNTLGARSGLTINGAVVREGDEWDYDDGSKPFIHHKRKLGGETDRKILAAWSTARANERPSSQIILSIDELLAVKAKSPRGGEPPWADTAIGFPAMCEKTAKRRLARIMPLNVFQLAARLEEAFEEQGLPSYITPERGLIIGGEITRESSPTPTAAQLTTPSPRHVPSSAEDQPAPERSSPESGAGQVRFSAGEIARELQPRQELTDVQKMADESLAAAAARGKQALQEEFQGLHPNLQKALRSRLEAIHWPIAVEVDHARKGAPA
jgi:recombination protein RecT